MTLHPAFKIFFSPLDADHEVLLQQQIGHFDLQGSDNLKSKFLACNILNFYKNHMVLCRWFPTPSLISNKLCPYLAVHTTVNSCSLEKKNKKTTKSMLSNRYFLDVLLSTSSFNPDITFLFCFMAYQPFLGHLMLN